MSRVRGSICVACNVRTSRPKFARGIHCQGPSVAPSTSYMDTATPDLKTAMREKTVLLSRRYYYNLLPQKKFQGICFTHPAPALSAATRRRSVRYGMKKPRGKKYRGRARDDMHVRWTFGRGWLVGVLHPRTDRAGLFCKETTHFGLGGRGRRQRRGAAKSLGFLMPTLITSEYHRQNSVLLATIDRYSCPPTQRTSSALARGGGIPGATCP